MPARSPHSAHSRLENPSLFLLPQQVVLHGPSSTRARLQSWHRPHLLTSHRPTWQAQFWPIQYLWPMLGYYYQMLGPTVCHKLDIAHL